MKIVLAPDSYKGSLSAFEVATIMKEATEKIMPEAEVVALPMADGGEGTLDCLLHTKKSLKIPITVTGPLGKRIETYYGVIDEETAVIEAAMINGLTLVPPALRHPDHTTTYGVGEAILHALERGCKDFIICTGGSATNDGGFGMLQALGVKAYDERGHEVGIFGKDLFQVAQIDWSTLDERLANIALRVVCDVDNPLLGKDGCSFIYGAQKGLNLFEARKYDSALQKYSTIISTVINHDYTKEKSAGSAGGLGFAFLALGATVMRGAPYVAQAIDLESQIIDADFVITGEGRTDGQTLYGKAPGFVSMLAKKYNVPIFLISGSLSADRAKWRSNFTACFSIIHEAMPLERSMGEVEQLLEIQTGDVIQLAKTMHQHKIHT